jgi:hypothetical protein
MRGAGTVMLVSCARALGANGGGGAQADAVYQKRDNRDD